MSERSGKYNFYKPSRDGNDIADINEITTNFTIIDENIPSNTDLSALGAKKQDKFADVVDSSGHMVTADDQRKMTERSLRMAQNEAAKARRTAEEKAAEAWRQKEQDSGITAARQREKDLARQKSESAERHRLEQRSHNERAKGIEDRKWGK